MPRGGKRQGAGRPKGSKETQTLEKEEARKVLRQIVLREMEPMASAQIAAAKGLKYLVKRSKHGGKFEVVTREMAEGGIFEDENVVVEVWDKQPSVQAFTDLMNRALDKPAEQEQTINLTFGARAERVKAARSREHGDSRS